MFILRPIHPICYSSPLQLAWLPAFVHSNPPPTLTPLISPSSSCFSASAPKHAACTFIFPGRAHLLQFCQFVREKHNTVGEKHRRYLSIQITTRCFPFLPVFFVFPSFLNLFFVLVLPEKNWLVFPQTSPCESLIWCNILTVECSDVPSSPAVLNLLLAKNRMQWNDGSFYIRSPNSLLSHRGSDHLPPSCGSRKSLSS